MRLFNKKPLCLVLRHPLLYSSLILPSILAMAAPSMAAEAPLPVKPRNLALTLTANDPLHLFYEDALTPGNPITLSIVAHNRANKTGKVRYHWKLTDFWGKTVRSDRFTGAPVAAGGEDKWYLSFHRDADLKGRTGIYNFEITASKGRDKMEARTTFGVLPRPAPGLRERSMFGVAARKADNGALPRRQRIGARWLRTDAGVNWYAVEPKEKGTYEWDRFDRLVSETRAHNLLLLPVLDHAPWWAKPKDAENKPYQFLDAPANVQDHADFVAAAVARYAGEVKRWEIWDDPDVMGPAWRNTAQHFRDLMRADYAAAKAANPDAVILASGGTPDHLQDVVFAPGTEMAAFVDETSVQTKAANAPEEEFLAKAAHAVQVSRKHGKNTVWITEQGWPMGDQPEQMARYLPRADVLAALAGVSHLCWSTLSDESTGLFAPDGTPRAAAVAYATAARFLDDTIFVRDLWPHSRRIFGAVFKNPQGRKVAAVWAVGDKGSLTLDDAKAVEAYDVMGGKIGHRNGDRLEVPLGADLIYLTSEADQAVFLEQVGAARIAGITPVEVVVKPFLSPIAQTPPLRVQVTNHLNRPIEGDLQASAPKGWKLADGRVPFGPLEPGQTTLVEVPVRQSRVSPDNAYPVSVSAVSRHRGAASFFVRISGPDWRVRRDQTLFLAGSVPGSPTIDGDLSEWASEADLPVQATGKDYLSPWAPEGWRKEWTPGNLSAVVSTRHDESYFYVSARVTDNAHAASSTADDPYHHPSDGDSLQVAFGSAAASAGSGAASGRTLLTDTDYEFSLALTPQGPEAVRLHTPESGYVRSYPTNPENGLGQATDVKLAVRRDDVNEVTTYEAAIPWSELPALAKDRPFRFAFKVNDRDREPRTEGWLESAAGAGEQRGSIFAFSPASQYTTANRSEWVLLPR